MNKDQKTAVVAELTDELKDADAIFAIDYRGISVPQAAELREGLRDADTHFRVVKNRLTLRAADAAGTAELKDHLDRPHRPRPGQAATPPSRRRRSPGWARSGSCSTTRAGSWRGRRSTPTRSRRSRSSPAATLSTPRPPGLIASPLTGLVRGLGSMVQGLALQLGQIAEQGLVSGEAPAEEAEPDPEPEESSEESSEEAAPEGEEAGEETQVEETTEGDAEIGEAQEETSEDSDEAKEDGD